jgi:phenylacetate-CoA ligase
VGLVTELRRVLEALPPGVREAAESGAAWVPRPLIYGSTFRRVRAQIAATERLPAAELAAWQNARLAELVRHAYARVPYYRRVMDERGVRPEHVRTPADLRLLPLLTKEDVREQGDALLARGLPRAGRERVATGGTSGVPLSLWIDRGRSSIEWGFMTWQWQMAGYRVGDRRAVLRGNLVSGAARGRAHEWHPLLDELVLSTFHLSSATLPAYLAALARYRPVFLHAYPSSAETLAQLLDAVPAAERPRFRGLLLGSENLYPAQRELLERAFGCRAFAYYGHTEKCLMGAGCERSDDYHLFPQYGVLEVLDASGRAVGPGGTGTIVGTGFMNRVMPFLRYATDDLGTVAEGPCPCGRAYPRLTRIEGRWEGEKLYGLGGRVFSMTALNTHGGAFERVLRFQIRQEKVGAATVLVVPGAAFQQGDVEGIAGEYTRRAGDSIRFTVELVESLPLTERGKFKFIDQHLDDAAAGIAPGSPAR